MWVRSPVYFSRAIPSDLLHRFNKWKIEISLRTKSEVKAAKSAAVLSDRLERYWDILRMEMIYSRELGISIVCRGQTDKFLQSALILLSKLQKYF